MHPQLRLLFFALAATFACLPADNSSLLQGVPLDFRVAGPLLLIAGLMAIRGSVRRWHAAVLALLCALKLVTFPFTIQHGLIGEYYSTPDLSGPVEQVRLDRTIDF